MCSWIKDSSGLSQDCLHDTVRIPAQGPCIAQVQEIGGVLLTSLILPKLLRWEMDTII